MLITLMVRFPWAGVVGPTQVVWVAARTGFAGVAKALLGVPEEET